MWITFVGYVDLVAWDSLVGTATLYRLEGLGTKSWFV